MKDIVKEGVSSIKKSRLAEGELDGCFVKIAKTFVQERGMFAYDVKAEIITRGMLTSSEGLFATEDEADKLFDEVVEKYELDEKEVS